MDYTYRVIMNPVPVKENREGKKGIFYVAYLWNQIRKGSRLYYKEVPENLGVEFETLLPEFEKEMLNKVEELYVR